MYPNCIRIPWKTQVLSLGPLVHDSRGREPQYRPMTRAPLTTLGGAGKGGVLMSLSGAAQIDSPFSQVVCQCPLT